MSIMRLFILNTPSSSISPLLSAALGDFTVLFLNVLIYKAYFTLNLTFTESIDLNMHCRLNVRRTYVQ